MGRNERCRLAADPYGHPPQDQIAAVRKAIRIERDDYDDSRQPRLKELAAARDQLGALNQRTAAARRTSEARPGPARRESEADMDQDEGVRRRERSPSRGREVSETG